MSNPRYFTERSLIRGLAAHWRASYPHNFRLGCGAMAYDITHRLEALDGETATAADVEAIIGNGSWTKITCDGCGLSVSDAVEAGAEPDYESRTATLCRPCVEAALAAFDNPGTAWSVGAEGEDE